MRRKAPSYKAGASHLTPGVCQGEKPLTHGVSPSKARKKPKIFATKNKSFSLQLKKGTSCDIMSATKQTYTKKYPRAMNRPVVVLSA
jgi:hypothetical protein